MADKPPNPGERSGDALPQELYDQLRAIAHVRMSRSAPGHTLQRPRWFMKALMRMTELGRIGAAERPMFFRNAAEAMRRILIDHARTHRREKRGGGRQRVPLEEVDVADDNGNSVDLLALDEAICRLALQAPDAASVVRLRFYAGLSVDEIAETIGTSPRSVDRLWVYARARLWHALHGEAGTDDTRGA